ncbi:aminoglycoside phosphotransferase [Streptomyces wedmorensis]|uniref:aminoglycoside phosphotransferase n=1 Tax=Streptomyces wedmorensis TaxID=43759 RepID=UPI003445F20B
MPVERAHWEDLPPTVRAAVEAHIGPVQHAHTVAAGVNSGIAAVLESPNGSVFLKGVPLDHPQIHTQRRETLINPYLPNTSPRILWHVEAEGWDLIGYERISGRHADYSPGSPDLPLVAAAVRELQSTECPEIGIKLAEDRWKTYAGPAGVEQLAGTALLHTDLAPHNVLVADRAHLIDWAWPTRGAAWIDPAVLILRLMEAGHSASDADAWARAQFTSWGAAPYDAVDAFSEANTHAWDEIAENDPQPWKRRMAQIAHEWLTYWHRSPAS